MKQKFHKPVLQQGFSLIELAIVLLIVTLLLGGLLVPLTAQIDQQKTRETQKTLADIKEALIGFALVNGRLPCPASATSNGQESPVGGGNCTNFYNGFVPAATLGMTPISAQGLLLDGWNNPLRYAVSNEAIGTSSYALTSSNGMKSATINSLSNPSKTLLYVCGSASGIVANTSCGTAVSLTNTAPALVYSLGKNGSIVGAGLDEAANANNDKIFVSHEQTAASAANGEFDDMLSWLSTGILINRMVTAGQLP